MSDPILTFKNQAEWESWLDLNGSAATGAWLRLAKKAAGQRTVSYAEALASALCHGWIDGQKRGEANIIGFSDSRPGQQEVSGPRSTRQKLKLSSRREECALLECVRSTEPSRMVGGTQRIHQRVHRPSLTICKKPLMRIKKPKCSSRRSTARTDTPFCSGFRMSKRQILAPGRSLSSSKCWPMARNFTPSTSGLTVRSTGTTRWSSKVADTTRPRPASNTTTAIAWCFALLRATAKAREYLKVN